jgi:mycothiol synthase
MTTKERTDQRLQLEKVSWEVPNASPTSLPAGFTSQAARMDDLEAAVDLFNRYSQVHLGIRDVEVDELRHEWNTPRFDLQSDTRLAFTAEGKLVGYVEVWMTSNPPVHPWVWVRVDPDFEGLGIGEHLMSWAEWRARKGFARVPKNARVAYRAGAYSNIETTKRLFEEMGMELIRHSFRMLIEMESMPPEPRWPEGIDVRVFNPEKDAEAVYRADDEAFQDHFGYIEQPFEEGFERFMHHMTRGEAYDPTLWFLAMDGDQVAGVCLCRRWSHEDRETGYVSSLGVRRPWRRLGIGLALLRHAFGEFYRRGKRKVALGVDAENLTGALGLYEKAGMHVQRQFDLYEKELRAGVELSVQSLG